MLRSRVVVAGLAAVLLLSSCSAPSAQPDPAEPLPDGSVRPTPTPMPSASDQPLTNDDPRCKLWSSPLIMLQLILHPVKKDVAHFPPPALDATCRWEVAGGTNTIKYPHTYEALWLDASAATFDQVTAAFEAEGATVAVDETGGGAALYGWITIATISSPDGSGELVLRAPNHDFPAQFVTFEWTRA